LRRLLLIAGKPPLLDGAIKRLRPTHWQLMAHNVESLSCAKSLKSRPHSVRHGIAGAGRPTLLHDHASFAMRRILMA
jgi:hypothetical protein